MHYHLYYHEILGNFCDGKKQQGSSTDSLRKQSHGLIWFIHSLVYVLYTTAAYSINVFYFTSKS